MGEPISTGKIPARAVEAAATILHSPDDLEPWPLASGARVSWRDDGRPGARFCARLGGGEFTRSALEGGPFPWHRFDTGYVDRDGPVMAGEVRQLDGMGEGEVGALVALARAHAAPGGVVLAGRLAHWVDPVPYWALFGLSAEWRPGGDHGMALVDVRVVPAGRAPGFPVPPELAPGSSPVVSLGLGEMRRATRGVGPRVSAG